MSRILRSRNVRTLLSVGIAVFVVAQIVAVGAGALLPELPSTNPFAEYASLKPGEPIPTTDNFNCEYNYNYPPAQGSFSYCMHFPDDGSIEWVSIAAKEGIIQRVTFGVQLRYGDLVAVFGQAESRRRNSAITNYGWNGFHALSMVREWTRISMYTPVTRVVFSLEDQVE